MSDKDLPSDRHFGLTMGCSLCVLAYVIRQSHVAAGISLLVAFGLLIVGFWKPGLLRPLNRWWMQFGLFIAHFTNPILVGLMYCAVLTPLAILLRLFKGNFLEIKLNPGASSYWVKRKVGSFSPDSLKRQF